MPGSGSCWWLQSALYSRGGGGGESLGGHGCLRELPPKPPMSTASDEPLTNLLPPRLDYERFVELVASSGQPMECEISDEETVAGYAAIFD